MQKSFEILLITIEVVICPVTETNELWLFVRELI
jgi:hypothetical protein